MNNTSKLKYFIEIKIPNRAFTENTLIYSYISIYLWCFGETWFIHLLLSSMKLFNFFLCYSLITLANYIFKISYYKKPFIDISGSLEELPAFDSIANQMQRIFGEY